MTGRAEKSSCIAFAVDQGRDPHSAQWPSSYQSAFERERFASRGITATYARRGASKTLAFALPLLPAVEIGSWNRTWRCDDFPIALEYSPPVETTECGGPIVDRSGRVVGITVGQSNPANGWAIPAEPIQRLINEAKSGKLERWPER